MTQDSLGKNARPCPKNNQIKKKWVFVSSGRAPAYQAQIPEFKP
jgi:hypothetical protein